MNRIIAFSFALLIILGLSILFKPIEKSVDFAIAIHGGAGTITRKNMTAETEAAYRSKLEEALNIGSIILENGGTSLDAVVAAISIMEDSELFNAGKGAVFTNAGTNELDASIMDGSNLLAGAVAGVKTVKNPITAARKVMENTWHVMLSGEGADQFAKEQNLEIVDPSYFYTQRRWDYLKKVQAEKYGTVGCVALDKNGNIAAGTSTGGMTNKKWNRIGDAPIIGAGTYANNKSCAVSSTGWGEYFIRGVVAYDIAALMEYKNLSIRKAAKTVIEKISKMGGDGGVIAIDNQGNIAMEMNTSGMYRAHINSKGEIDVKIYK